MRDRRLSQPQWLGQAEYLDGLARAGFADASVTLTAEAAPGLHSAIIRAVKPTTS
jgi:hypothetical protein